MVDVLRAQTFPDAQHPQPGRQRLPREARAQSKPPLRFAGDGDDYSVLREDSPLLGPQPVIVGEEKMEDGNWDVAVLSEHGRDMDLKPDEGGHGDAAGGESEHGSEAASRRTTASAAPTTMSSADEALLRTFMEVMSEGEH